MQNVKVPQEAKREARKGLALRKKLPKSQKFGLSESEARKKGVNSGVSRAKQIINSDFISVKDAKSIARFYSRFKNCKTKKCEGAIMLWGGRKFGKTLFDRFFG